jgi:hypothetical protein
VSYILDALKKAAEQRDVHAPALRRLLSPAPEIIDSPRWRMAVTGGAAALGGAGLVAVMWMLWPTATPVMVTEAPTPTTRVQSEPTPAVQPPAPPAPPIVRTTPAPAAAKIAAEKRTPRPVEARRPPADDAFTRPQPGVGAPPVIAALRPVPPAIAAPAPMVVVPPVPVVTPAPIVAAPPRVERTSSPLKLEVIVYSDERARRLAFINGRKYLEGDTVLEGIKIQEIQPNAVVIVEYGRRVLLRP